MPTFYYAMSTFKSAETEIDSKSAETAITN